MTDYLIRLRLLGDVTKKPRRKRRGQSTGRKVKAFNNYASHTSTP